MATITVRNLDEDVQHRLKERAAKNHRSMEAEARAILSEAVRVQVDTFMSDWIVAVEPYRGELDLPDRSAPREVDLGW